MTYAEQLYNYMIMVTDAGYHLPIQDENGAICIFSPTKDEDGNNRRSGWWISSLEEAKQVLGGWPGYTKEEFLESATEENWKPLTPFMLETKPLPVGTEVVWKDEPRRRGKLFVGSFDYLVNTYNIVENLDDKFAFGARPDQIIPIFSLELPPTYPMSEDEMIEALKKSGKLKPGMIVE